jgi:probable RNA-binding protein EIF1AD
MSGLGRKTHYRKHLTDSVLHDLPEPTDNERIAKVVATRGGNQFDIILANQSQEESQLALLPTKFHKLVWVKRGDYVIVETGGGEESGDDQKNDDVTGVRYIISHILYKDQVKHLKSKALWPDNDSNFGGEGTDPDADDENDEDDDGIVYNTGYEEDDDLFVNTNRRPKVQEQEEDSSDEDSD